MEEKTLLEYWLVLYRRRLVILLVIISSMAAALVFSNTIPPTYEAKAVCFIPQFPAVGTLSLPTSEKSLARSPQMPSPTEEPNAPYIGILKSRSIAEFIQKEFPHKKVGELLKRDLDFVVSNEYLIEIYARDRDSVKSAGIANAYVKYLNKIVNSHSLTTMKKNQLIMEQEIKSTKASLAQARQRLQTFQKRHNIAALEEETRQLISQKMDFQSKHEATEVEQQENERKIAALKVELAKEGSLFEQSDLVITSPLLEQLREGRAEVDRKLAGLKAHIHESHPDFIDLKEQHAQIEKSIINEIKMIVNSQIKAPDTFYEETRQQLVGLFVEKERIQSSLEAYRIVIAGIDRRTQKIPGLAAQHDSLEMEVKRYRALLQTLENNLEEVKIQCIRDLQSVVMVDEAVPSPKPAFPVLWLNLLVSASAGLIAGILYCFFLNYIEQTKGDRILILLRTLEKAKRV